jgi:hypothetical protein
MKFNIKNTRGQIVGYVQDNIYFTQRDVKRGEIFIKKHFFNNVYMLTPIAIDTDILERLIKAKVSKSRIMIMNLFAHSFVVEFDNEDIMKRGVEINYDKRNVEGQNVTGFGSQIVFDMAWGTKVVPDKDKITRYIK